MNCPYIIFPLTDRELVKVAPNISSFYLTRKQKYENLDLFSN